MRFTLSELCVYVCVFVCVYISKEPQMKSVFRGDAALIVLRSNSFHELAQLYIKIFSSFYPVIAISLSST